MPGGTVEPKRVPVNFPVRSWSSVSWVPLPVVVVVVVVAAAACVILAPSEKAAAVTAELITKSRRFMRAGAPRRLDVNIGLSPFETKALLAAATSATPRSVHHADPRWCQRSEDRTPAAVCDPRGKECALRNGVRRP